MPEMRLDRARVVAIIGELVAAGVTEHVGMRLDAWSAAVTARSTVRVDPAADSGAPRSETNTNGDDGLAASTGKSTVPNTEAIVLPRPSANDGAPYREKIPAV